MNIQIVTVQEGIKLGIVHSRLYKEGHGAFGEPDNSYEDYVVTDKKTQVVRDNDFIL